MSRVLSIALTMRAHFGKPPQGQPLSPAASLAAINWKRELGASGSPSTQLDWALYWIARGIHVFPARHFLGSPLVDNFIKHATIDRARVIDWWSEYPDADICCVPSLSDYHVVAAFADEGGIEVRHAHARQRVGFARHRAVE